MNDRDARLAAWLSANLGLADVRPGRLLGGGNSNVTQLVEHRDGRVVIRRPPDNAISASAANGVRREYAMLQAICGQVRVPRPLAQCDDTEVVGQPFIVVEFIDGVSITSDLPDAYPRDAQTLGRVGEALVDAIAAAHRLDWEVLPVRRPSAPPADYVPRQLERWVAARRRDAVRELPLVERIARWLESNMPKTRAAGVLHGDFHLDNTLFARDAPRLEAIIDWELATLGDPMADLGLMLAFWGDRDVDAPGFAFVQAVTRGVPGLVTREALAERWSHASGHDAGSLGFYRVFALWRLAVIVEGAYVLFCKGLVDDDYSRNLEHDVPSLLAEAAIVAGID